MHKRKVFVLSAVALALLLVAGGLMASNMGFKLNRVLSGTIGSGNGTNSLGLPYNQQVGLVNCGQLVLDMGGFSSLGGPVINVQRLAPASNTYTLCTTGRAVATNFPITPGESVRVRVNSNLNYIVVGSHDPAKTINLKAQDGGVTSITGLNEFAYPYHSTAVNCGALALELGGFSSLGGPVITVQQYNPTETPTPYTLCSTGRAVASNFALTPGFGYRIHVAANTNFVPSHY